METKMIKIAQFDDDKTWLDKAEALLKIKNNENEDISINFKGYADYNNLMNEIKDDEFVFDYLILDVYDKKKDDNVAKAILDAIKAKRITKTKIILLSLGATSKGAIHEIKYSQEEYPFLMDEHIIPKASVDELVDKIIDDILLNNVTTQFDYFDKDDVLLKAEINSIGEKNISLVIRNIIKKKQPKKPILVERMSSGFSGASVFKLHIDEGYSILKVSKNKEKLSEEIENAEKYYVKLPHPFRINISNKEDYSVNGIGAYLIENVPDGLTLFDFLKSKNNNDRNEITQFFKKLFTEGNCMMSFYSENKIRVEKYSFINNKFDEIKYSKVKLALKELQPLLNDEISNPILDYIQDYKYDNIRPDRTKKENYIVVCHGDFHSRNIMNSNGDPTIIDTGGMKEDYWCMDICRLMSNLFIEGFDCGTKKYYDINEIQNQVELAKRMINLEKLDTDNENYGFIIALNWLIDNIASIYGDMFCKWEFQLGLLKEFLQISYRKNSIPPNKRAIAILSAYECLISANNLFE